MNARTNAPKATMNRRQFLIVSSGFAVAGAQLGAGTETSRQDRCREAANRGRKFLTSLFDEELHLLPEYRGSSVYWLYHDNYLAAKVLQSVQPELAAKIVGAIHRYQVTHSGKIEILFGEAKQALPFRHPRLEEVRRHGDKIVKTEVITDREMRGWDEYADLLLWASMATLASEPAQSRKRFDQALAMWDGIGLKDRVVVKTGKYAVYKLALAIEAAFRHKLRSPDVDAMITLLLDLQSSDGGWITDYTDREHLVGLANVETTSLAVHALDSIANAGSP